MIYSPGIEQSPHIERDVEVVNGIPQVVYKLPLRSLPDGTKTGGELTELTELTELIDRIIIGPSQFSFAMFKAFSKLLGDAGFEKPETRVAISDVPLR